MGQRMINIRASKNWHQDKVKRAKTFTWDINEANHRIYNDIPMYDGEIVEDKRKKVVK
jgi:hypothetical protein